MTLPKAKGLKDVDSSLWGTHRRATERHLSYMGSHSVSCHPTQMNMDRINPSHVLHVCTLNQSSTCCDQARPQTAPPVKKINN